MARLISEDAKNYRFAALGHDILTGHSYPREAGIYGVRAA